MTTTNDFLPGGSPESFAVASNWSLNVVPNSTEDANINSANGDAVINATGETVNTIETSITDVLRIENDATLTTVNGSTGNFGSIIVSTESQLALEGGTFDNAATIELDGFNISGFTAFMDIEGPSAVTLDGGGNVEMVISGGPTANLITSPGEISLINEDNTISGDGTLGDGLRLTNDSLGLIETNNSTSSSGGRMQIEGSAGGGSLLNDGIMRIDPSGEFIFGEDSLSATINNENEIILDPDLQTATVAITGNVTIQAVFGTTGHIQMEGPGYSGNQIVSDGNPAALTLSDQTIDGAGSIGDANLTLTVLNGSTIDADASNEPLILFTGGNTIENGGILAASGGDLVINSAVSNNGIIEVNGGNSIVDLVAAVAGPGAINVGGGTLDVHAAVSDNITFTSGDATIAIESGAALQGVISGAAPTDEFDVKFVNFVSGVHAVWQQNGSTGTLSLVNNGSTLAAFTLSGQYASSDFVASSDGNGGTLIQVVNPGPPSGATADMIMRDSGSGDYEIYDLGGNAILDAYALGQVGLQWQVAGVGGFDGSDTSDMVLRDTSGTLAGSFEVYDISDNNITNRAAMGQVGTEWQVAGFGDFSSNAGETDMMMRRTDGTFEVYDISNNVITGASAIGAVGTEWQVMGFGDFSGNPNESDMLLRNVNTAALELYDIQNGHLTTAAPMGAVGLDWQVAGFADFSGNANETDLMMRNVHTGMFELYDIHNSSIVGASAIGAVGLDWQVAGFGPLDGAGSTDMVLRNVSSGSFEYYDIVNGALTNAAPLGAVGLEWQVAGIAADPPGSANAQLTQSMASFAPNAGASEISSPLVQAAAPEASSSGNLLGATNQPKLIA